MNEVSNIWGFAGSNDFNRVLGVLAVVVLVVIVGVGVGKALS